MLEEEKLARFEQCIMPHMNAAYNLARWLTGKDEDAQDVVQDAYLRAFKFFGGFRGGDSRSWLLRIVRNVFNDWLHEHRHEEQVAPFDENIEYPDVDCERPDTALLHKADAAMMKRAIESLPVEFREVLVMRELEGMSYKEISDIADVPLGTVMSRLARAREQLRKELIDYMRNEKE